jgi:hypothetical protein
MATSGTYAFTINRDEVISAALRTLGAYGSADTIPPADITNCAQALNIMVKSWITKGLPLWAVETFGTPMIVGQEAYDLTLTSPGGYRPGRVLDAFLRGPNPDLNDVTLTIESRYDYNKLGSKFQPGIPNQLFYSPDRNNGIVTVYNVPNLLGYTLFTTVQRPLQDFNLATDNPDMPQEAFLALKWNLADELALEYAAPQTPLTMVNSKAKLYLDELMGWEQEQTSVYFTPSQRSM